MTEGWIPIAGGDVSFMLMPGGNNLVTLFKSQKPPTSDHIETGPKCLSIQTGSVGHHSQTILERVNQLRQEVTVYLSVDGRHPLDATVAP